MKYDKQMELVEEIRIPDDIGGSIIITNVVGTILALTAPVTAELMMSQIGNKLLAEYGAVSKAGLKIFTKDLIPNEFLKIRYGGKTYTIVELADFGSKRMATVVDVGG